MKTIPLRNAPDNRLFGVSHDLKDGPFLFVAGLDQRVMDVSVTAAQILLVYSERKPVSCRTAWQAFWHALRPASSRDRG